MDTLTEAVLNQISDDREEALEILKDVARSGADAGWPGFTYHSDTTQFYRDNRKAIEALIKETAEEIGERPAEMVASFKCLDCYTEEEICPALYGRFDAELYQIYNALAWFALEETAYRLDN